MSLYLVAGQGTVADPAGARQHLPTSRVRRYPSDTTDAEWRVLAPLVPAGTGRGRPIIYPRRDVVDAIRYLDRTGCQWDAMPADFPHHKLVYHYFKTWTRDGTLARIHDSLREQVREQVEGRNRQPSAAVIDSQSVRAAETVGRASRGYDAGKKINGRKRHIAVDTCGLLLAVLVEVLLEGFRGYLRAERGVSGKTARDYAAAVRPLLDELADATHVRVEAATAAGVSGFIVGQCRIRNVRAAQLVVTATRALLRYLHIHGLVDGGLVAAVPKVPDRREQLPRGLEPAQVQAMLDACDHSPAGRRDYAILVVLARLGLRAGEAARLCLEDVDWQRGQLTVRGKPRRVDVLPLPVDVGQALVGYLRWGRPVDALDRSVFVRVLAPHRGLTPVGVTQVVVAAGVRAGVGVVTAHRLRHSAATAMLRAGTPLAAIGQVLRHQRPATTALYAKTDVAALRTLARRWPGGAA